MNDKKDRIKNVKKLLDLGYTVKIYGNYNGIGKVWLHNGFIMYQNFGQSAVRNTLKDLTWLINNIFNAKRKNFSYSVM